jgi:orotate phosphoribosyltransferase
MSSRGIAQAGLEIKAIKLNPDNPFQWASGYRMPIYNDNRMFLFFDEYRKLITDAFYEIANDLPFSVVAGTSTAGIPWGALLASRFKAPFVYVREKSKDHGLKNQIEGIDSESDLDGHQVILIEDLISTGGSSVKAVQAIRDANGICNNCLSVFNYGLDKAAQEFEALNPRCNVRSLLTYDTLLEVAKETKYINDEQVGILAEWRTDPFGWGEKHGFPKVEK